MQTEPSWSRGSGHKKCWVRSVRQKKRKTTQHKQRNTKYSWVTLNSPYVLFLRSSHPPIHWSIHPFMHVFLFSFNCHSLYQLSCISKLFDCLLTDSPTSSISQSREEHPTPAEEEAEMGVEEAGWVEAAAWATAGADVNADGEELLYRFTTLRKSLRGSRMKGRFMRISKEETKWSTSGAEAMARTSGARAGSILGGVPGLELNSVAEKERLNMTEAKIPGIGE